MGSLPVPLSTFVGREREVAAVRALLDRDDVRLITLTGPGGVGKSRLAVRIASDIAAEFPYTVWFVSLATVRDPALVASAIAQALRVPEVGGRPIAEGIVAFLRERAALLVLDNFEHILDAAPRVVDLLARCPDAKALVTSRAVLRVSGEHDVVVPPLALPDLDHLPAVNRLLESDAIRLFVERVTAAKPDFALTETTGPAIAAICHKLDGLPLAIELAAARVRVLPPAALLARLDRRLPVLAGGVRDQPERLRTMRQAIAWSYDLLTPEEQALFRRLSVFAGGCALAAAEAVSETGDGRRKAADDANSSASRLPPSASVFDGLAALVDHSLLRQTEESRDDVRFQMLETLREYGGEVLESTGEAEQVRQAHATYFLDHGTALRTKIDGPEGPVALDRIETEHPNLRVALGWAIARGDKELALRFIALLWKFWFVRRHLSDGRAWIERALAMPGEAPPALVLEARYAAGTFAWHQDDPAAASRHGEAGLAVARQVDDVYWHQALLTMLGRVAHREGNLVEASERYDAAFLLLQTILAPNSFTMHALAMLATARGAVAHELGDRSRAIALVEEARGIWQDRADRWGLGIVATTLAAIAAADGDAERAKALYRESIVLNQEIGDASAIAEGLVGLAALAAIGAQPDHAARLFGAAEALNETTGRPGRATITYDYGPTVSALRATLGEPAFATAWQTGRDLPLADAVAEALVDPTGPVAHTPPAPGRATHGLTPRELEVLHLVVEGMTDQQIADILFVGRRTITSHVGSILGRLDLSSRTAAAAFAVRHNLV